MKLSLDKLIVTSLPPPRRIPSSDCIDNLPEVVSASSDHRKFATSTPPSASESVAVPLNFTDATAEDS